MPCLSRQAHKIQQTPNMDVPDKHSHTSKTFRRPTWNGEGNLDIIINSSLVTEK